MSHQPAVTRLGTTPNRAGRAAVAALFAKLLSDGEAFTDPEAEVTARDVRDWAARLRNLSLDLADTIEAPARNRVLEILENPSVPDEANALDMLLLNVAGESPRGYAQEIAVNGRTVERLVEGEGCQARVALAVAEPFALAVTELFRTESLTVRTVGELREILHGKTPSMHGDE